MIIFNFSGLDAKDYLDKPRPSQFHPKVEGQGLLFSQAEFGVDKYEFGSFCSYSTKLPISIQNSFRGYYILYGHT